MSRKPPDKKQRREMREKLLPGALAVAYDDVNMPLTSEKVQVRVIEHALQLADELALAALTYDDVLEERAREAKKAAKQKQREADALAKNNRKTLRGDFDAGPESVLT